MKRNIECEIAQTEGSLIRVLGVIERRGYKLLEMSVQPAGPDSYQLSLSLESARDFSILVKQLERLVDVRDVYLMPTEYAATKAGVDSQVAQNFRASWLAS